MLQNQSKRKNLRFGRGGDTKNCDPIRKDRVMEERLRYGINTDLKLRK